VLFFYPKDDTPGCTAEACGFRDLTPEFHKLGTQVVGISRDSVDSHRAFAGKHGLAFVLLADVTGQVSAAFGALREDGAAARQTFLIDANQRIRKIYEAVDPRTHAAEVLADLKSLIIREEPRQILMQAPVLLIPAVFEPAFCRHLIHVWETEGNEDSGFMVQRDGLTVGKYDYGQKIRRDHFLTEGPTRDQVKRCLAQRVVPEIKRAFHYQVTRFEDFRIACYDSSRGGYFRPHRDNTTDGTAHRRFAISINLNTGEYEGGFLRFPEYGRYGYRPDVGGAVVFSGALLHEATDVSAGRRFVLLSFLYGEKEAKMREEYNRRIGGVYRAQMPGPAPQAGTGGASPS
jgi:peroxiredoxin/predicted 2-oxoglutarate/Fe(II)-dependent dioxygenase YbiX